MNNWTVIYTSDHLGRFPHIATIQKTNPEAQLLLMDFSNNLPKHFIWKNPDILIRPWIKSNIQNILHNNIALVEYDTYLGKKLPDINDDNFLIGRNFFKYNPGHTWKWFDNLYLEKIGNLKDYACGLTVFALYMMSKNVLEKWISPEYDFMYTYDLNVEMRFPTICNYCGVNISGDKQLLQNILLPSHMTQKEWNLNIADFYHPVK